MEHSSGVLNSIAKGLRENSEALLPFGLAVVAFFAIVAGADPWLSFGFAGLIYIAYMFRSEKSDKHEERMAQLQIDKLEEENAARLAQQKQRLIAKKPK